MGVFDTPGRDAIYNPLQFLPVNTDTLFANLVKTKQC